MSRRLAREEFENRITMLFGGDIIPLGTYINNHTKMDFLYIPNGRKINRMPSTMLYLDDKGRQGLLKSLDMDYFKPIVETSPKIFHLLKNKSDGYKYSFNTHKELEFICPHCHSKIIKRPNQLINDKTGLIRCINCSDGFSYPEKYILNVLQQNKIDFIYQLSSSNYKWCGKYRYDFYIPNLNWIIEVNGIQHYEDCSFSDCKSVKKNDKEKEKLAIKHGVKKYIVIDARKSQSTFIKNSILMSDLSKIISTNTNWELCDLNASSSLLTIICNSWNKKYESIDKLAKDNHVHKVTIINYLKRGASIGLIDFDYNEYLKHSKEIHYEKVSESLKKKVMCVETGKIYESIKDAQNNFCKTSKTISKAINGKLKTAYGFHWKLVN